MSTSLLIAIGIACLVAVAAGVVVLRTRSALESRVREIAAGVGHTTELAASLEPADVLDRTLDGTIALPYIDAALIVLNGAGEDPLVASSGLDDDEIQRAIFQMPSHSDVRALKVTYRYRLDDATGQGSKLPTAALIVELRAHGETIGSLAAITRSRDAEIPQSTAEALDALARRAGPAIGNARRFIQARAQAELDSLTGLLNRRLFYEFLNREIARAQRYERYVSLILFDLDDFKRINDRIGHLGGDAALTEVANRVRSVVRSTDIACRIGGDEFAVILPESNRDDAELLAERIATAIRQQKIDKVGALRISAGVAEVRPADGATDLFQRADEALYRAKEGGKARTASL